MTAPANGSTASGTVTVSATATPVAPAMISSVQFLLDGQPLGAPVTSAPYTFDWTVGSTVPGSHTLSARATDSNGIMATAVPVTVTVPPPSGGGGGSPPTLDKSVTVTGHGAVTTAAFSTTAAGETLLAFVGSDGPSGAGRQTVTVSGGGLTWTLVKRSNGQPGDAEIWASQAANTLTNVTVTFTPATSGFDEQMTVMSFKGAGGIGASAANSGRDRPADGEPRPPARPDPGQRDRQRLGSGHRAHSGGPPRPSMPSGSTPAAATRTGRRAPWPPPRARARR